MEERDLVKKILAGDQLVIKKFYKEYSPYLYASIATKVEKKEDIEEILQDTFLSILDSLPLFNFRSSLLTWAKQIAHHEVADFYRKRKIKSIVFSRLPFLENLVSEALGPDLVYQEKEIKEEINRVFKRLSEGYREILRLKYIEGLTVDEIAKVLSISFKSTESRLFRARLAFRQEWQESYQLALSDSSPFLPSKRPI